jgi:hypothetical protein
MQAAASHASAMPPRSACSAERRDFSFWLRIAALSVRPSGPTLGRLVIVTLSGDSVAHPNRLHLSSFSDSDGHGAPRSARLSAPAKSTLNLSMLFSTQCNGDINLCSMVGAIPPLLHLLGDRTAAGLSGIAAREGLRAILRPVTGRRCRNCCCVPTRLLNERRLVRPRSGD